jgi:hypothetical protein
VDDSLGRERCREAKTKKAYHGEWVAKIHELRGKDQGKHTMLWTHQGQSELERETSIMPFLVTMRKKNRNP